MSLLPQILIFVAAAAGGAVNAIAGGGTLLSFPALMASGLPSTIANGTNSAALAVGQAASLLGYRDLLHDAKKTLAPMAAIGAIGAAAGAGLLLLTPERFFEKAVPFLILAATLLFALQDKIKRWRRPPNEPALGERLPAGVAFFLLGIAIYGGYFGAGIGILTLAALGLLGHTDIHRMNGLKALFTGGINVVAAVVFAAGGKIAWASFLIATAGAILGGWAGAHLARRVPAALVRRVVIGIGFTLAAKTLVDFWLR